MNRHFMNNPHAQVNGNGLNAPYSNMNPDTRSFSSGKGKVKYMWFVIHWRQLCKLKYHAILILSPGLLPENLIWFYVVQLSAALRSIHNNGLACRVLDPTKVLLTDKTRYNKADK